MTLKVTDTVGYPGNSCKGFLFNIASDFMLITRTIRRHACYLYVEPRTEPSSISNSCHN